MMLPDAAYHLLNKVDSCNDVRAENKTLIQATQEEINASFDDNESKRRQTIPLIFSYQKGLSPLLS